MSTQLMVRYILLSGDYGKKVYVLSMKYESCFEIAPDLSSKPAFI